MLNSDIFGHEAVMVFTTGIDKLSYVIYETMDLIYIVLCPVGMSAL